MNGLSLQILKIVFRVKGNGVANVILDDAAVTANDGLGTNILSLVRGLKIISTHSQEILEIVFQPIRKIIMAEPIIVASPTVVQKIRLRIRLE